MTIQPLPTCPDELARLAWYCDLHERVGSLNQLPTAQREFLMACRDESNRRGQVILERLTAALASYRQISDQLLESWESLERDYEALRRRG
jgi:hypothetical protein